MSNIDFTEAILEESNRLYFALTPLSCDKIDVYKFFLKYSEYIQNNHYLVTVNKGENTDRIEYDSFIDYESKSKEKIFFIDNIRFFMYYNIDFFNKSNILIFLIDIQDLEEVPFKYIMDNTTFNTLYPKNLCLDVNLEYKKVSTNIYKNQLTKYKEEFYKYLKTKEENVYDTFNPANYLNVYYDKIIPSLEDISLEAALERAPKFKSIFLELLLKNKKRHLVNLVDNRYGIEPFTVIYNKLNTKVELIIIKSSDDYITKNKKLAEFNKNNSPKILLTDYIFTGKMIPKNINVYHITNGGQIEHLCSIFDHLKTYSGYNTNDKNFLCINHIASTLKGELTLDNKNEIAFNEILTRYSLEFNKIKENTIKIFLEGNVIKMSKS